MKLSEFAKPITAQNKFLKAAFGGMQGSGKSRTATELIIGCYMEKFFDSKKPMLYIDNEKGSRFLIPKLKPLKVEVLLKDTNNLADVQQAFDYLNSGELSCLFIDSLTKIYYKFVYDYRQSKAFTDKNGKRVIPPMYLNDWGKVAPEWQLKFSDLFLESNGNIIFTGRGGFEYETEEEEREGKIVKTFVKSGVKMKAGSETAFEPDLNIWMSTIQEVEGKSVSLYRQAQILKDRSDTIDGKTYKNPTFKEFKPVVDFLNKLETGEVAKESISNDELIPGGSDSIFFAERDKVKAEIESIHGIFDLFGFGTSKEDKKIKALIIKKVFGTLSMTTIENMRLNEITYKRSELERMYSEFKKIKDFDNFTIDDFIEKFKLQSDLQKAA